MVERPRIAVTRRLPEPVERRMAELFDVTLNPHERPLAREEIAALMRTNDVLVPTITDRIDGGLIAQAGPNLRLIANYGAGVDHIDLAACTSRGLTVTNTPGVLTEDTADMTMALILAVPRRLVEGERVLRAGKFPGWAPTWMMGHRVAGKKLGIVGMGRIGQAVARRARAFGLEVHYHNRRRAHASIEQELSAHYWESLDLMLARMDIVSVHCPHTPATFHLLSARRLKLMPRHAYVINTARGEIVDENALIRMLEAGEIAGAGLDVFTNEPAINPKFLALENVVLVPHLSSATIEARTEMGEKVIINIKTFLDGHRPPDRVLAAML
jgi:glyoxylate reductase